MEGKDKSFSFDKNSIVLKTKISTSLYQQAFLVLLAIFAFFVNLGIFEPDLMEARNFVTAREMLINHQWLLPTMNDAPRLEKPPFPTWLSAATMLFFGESLFSLRIPGALMACLLLFFTVRFCKTLFENQQTALIAGIVLATMPMIIQMGRTGSWDIFCQALMLGGIYHLYKGLLNSDKVHYKHVIYGGIFIGLSSMSKGPVAIYAMLLPFLLAYFIVFKFTALKGKGRAVILLTIIAVVLAIWWYIYAKIQAPEVSADIAVKEINAWSNRHTRSFFFYFSFPAFAGIWAVIMVASLFIKHYKRQLSHSKKYFFLLLWVLIAVLLLSVIPEKKERYLLPIYPPMAILVAQQLAHLIKRIKGNEPLTSVEKGTFNVFNFLFLFALFLSPIALYYGFVTPNYLSYPSWLLFTLPISIIVVMGYMNWKKKQLFNQLYLIALAFMLTIAVVFPGLPAFHYKNPEFKDIAIIKKEKWYNEFAFYTNRDLNLKALWRIGKPVKAVNLPEHWPEEDFIFIGEESPAVFMPLPISSQADITNLGEYDYYRSKSKFRLYVHKVTWK